ncbi:MAG: hypothetical protein P1V21_11030 [Rhizobiaceae bacterium]|nr:hypothetical protein [Rhizobiaceae bacterium]
MDHFLQQLAGPIYGLNMALICVQFIKQLHVFSTKCQPAISVSVGIKGNFSRFYRGKISQAAQLTNRMVLEALWPISDQSL